MENENLKKMGWLLGFIVLAAISCWATEHSFHLLISWMPEAFVWGLTIAFFIVASYGTKLIVDALNTDVWMDHRRRTFWKGTTHVVVFWLMMSVKTKPHTFFYNHNIGNVTQQDLRETSKYLMQIQNRENVDPAYDELDNRVRQKFAALRAEYNGIGQSGKKGGGEYVNQLIGEINNDLDHELPGCGIRSNTAAWNKFNPADLVNYENQMNNSLKRIKEEKYMASRQSASEARALLGKFEGLVDTISTMVELGDIDEAIITQTDGVVLSGYTCIKANQKYVDFADEDAKER